MNDVEKSVKAAIGACIAAYSKNIEEYFSYYADDMLMSVPDLGITMSKADYYAFWKEHEAAGFGASEAHVTDLWIQLSPSGDAAAAYFLEPTKLRFPAGHEDAEKRIIHTYITTCTLFKREGEWRIVNISVTTRDDTEK